MDLHSSLVVNWLLNPRKCNILMALKMFFHPSIYPSLWWVTILWALYIESSHNIFCIHGYIGGFCIFAFMCIFALIFILVVCVFLHRHSAFLHWCSYIIWWFVYFCIDIHSFWQHFCIDVHIGGLCIFAFMVILHSKLLVGQFCSIRPWMYIEGLLW